MAFIQLVLVFMSWKRVADVQTCTFQAEDTRKKACYFFPPKAQFKLLNKNKLQSFVYFFIIKENI